MPNTNKNALSEIADVLKNESAPSSERFKKKAIEHFGVERWNRHEDRKHKMHLAYLIIENIAKHDISLIPQECYGCGLLKTLAKCRAIAEGKSEVMKRKKYTAQEMRDFANDINQYGLDGACMGKSGNRDGNTVAAMLRQAACMMERCDEQRNHLVSVIHEEDTNLTGITLKQVAETELSIVNYILLGDAGKEER